VSVEDSVVGTEEDSMMRNSPATGDVKAPFLLLSHVVGEEDLASVSRTVLVLVLKATRDLAEGLDSNQLKNVQN